MQPTQFYIDSDKIQLISTWAKSNENFIIPILTKNGEHIVLDGHHRLYLANQLGITEIYIYGDEVDESIFDFVCEAENKKIYHIKDLTLLSHEKFINEKQEEYAISIHNSCVCKR